MGFVFPSEEALRTALSIGLIPAADRESSARLVRDATGQILIAPVPTPTDELCRRLKAAGIATAETLRDDGEVVDHWLQAIPLIRQRTWPVPDDQTPVLFDCPDRATAGEFVIEVLRLGNDRQSFRILTADHQRKQKHERVMLRVIGPPYYSLLRALETNTGAGIHAHIERAPGIWIEAGWDHPLVGQIQTSQDSLLLLQPARHWKRVAAAAFHDVVSSADVGPNVSTGEWEERSPPAIPATLRLSPGSATERPELWLLTDRGEESLDDFVRTAEPRGLDPFMFAVIERDARPIVVIRSRPRKSGPPSFDVHGAKSFRPYHGLTHLFLPCGSRITPPVSREIVQRLLAADSTKVYWLEPDDGGHFRPMHLPEQAFRPLTDWAEHVLLRDRMALETWASVSQCDFGPMREPDVPRPTEPSSESRPASAAATEQQRSPKSESRLVSKPPIAPLRAGASTFAAQSLTVGPAQEQLRAAESCFLALSGPLDSLERRQLWPELGRLNGSLGHAAEAALCWLNALWYCESPDARLAWCWVESEQALPDRTITPQDVDRLTAATQPNAAELRPLAAALVWASTQSAMPRGLAERLAPIQDYLAQHDRLLPIRAVWLVWHGLTQRLGHDPLALARVRDRVLERLLTDGLNPERDLPTFLRFAGNKTGERLRTIRDGLERIRLSIHRWSGFASDDSLQQTHSYIDLTFAFANARLGEAGTARALLAEAGQAIDASGSDAHRFLLEAYRWRIEQVLAGRPHAGSLPIEQIEYLEHMRREAGSAPPNDPVHSMAPYVVERMRKESRILEPQEELDPYRHLRREHDAVIRDMTRLADIHDPRVLSDGLRRVLSAAGTRRLAEVRLRILADALPLAARVGAALAGDLLDQVVAALNATADANDPIAQEKRAILLERALFFAVHFDRTDLVPVLAVQLEGLLDETTAPTVLEARSRLIGQSLRSLRRCGLRDATDRLLERLAAAAGDPEAAPDRRTAMERCRILLHVASGWLNTDQADRARPILDLARSLIQPATPAAADRPAALVVSLVGNYVATAALAPLDEAIQRAEALFAAGQMERIPNTFTTAPYYSRFHVSIAEAVALAFANEDVTFGPAARRWLDDDEYAVRRRIHGDVRAALERSH